MGCGKDLRSSSRAVCDKTLRDVGGLVTSAKVIEKTNLLVGSGEPNFSAGGSRAFYVRERTHKIHTMDAERSVFCHSCWHASSILGAQTE
jgi:hypothetical protein